MLELSCPEITVWRRFEKGHHQNKLQYDHKNISGIILKEFFFKLANQKSSSKQQNSHQMFLTSWYSEMSYIYGLTAFDIH